MSNVFARISREERERRFRENHAEIEQAYAGIAKQWAYNQMIKAKHSDGRKPKRRRR